MWKTDINEEISFKVRPTIVATMVEGRQAGRQGICFTLITNFMPLWTEHALSECPGVGARRTPVYSV